MDYLKTVEVTSYVTRERVVSSQLAAVNRVASRIIDAYCDRSLSIKYYKLNFELSRSMVGRIPIKPVVSVSPKVLTTGFRVAPLQRTTHGQREQVGGWADITLPTDLSDLYNAETGRIELSSGLDTDYARLYYGSELSRGRGAYAWLAELEVKAGHLVDTKLAEAAEADDTVITVRDATGVIEDETYLTIGDTETGAVQEYLVTGIDGDDLTISPALTADADINTGVYQVVPEEVKVATAMIIEDRLIYEPNTKFQVETLDVITDKFSRATIGSMPADAMELIAPYRNK